jgi:recombination endonuclease VII
MWDSGSDTLSHMKTCSICNKPKAPGEFGPNKHSADGRDYRCQACNRGRAEARRARYRALWADKDPHELFPDRKKVCTKCRGEPKLIIEFARDRCAPDGLQRWCRQCQVREGQLREFGVAPGPTDVCAICSGRHRLSVDHCHKTDEVRGYLCGYCNPALGSFKDDPKLLRRAADYLEGLL